MWRILGNIYDKRDLQLSIMSHKNEVQEAYEEGEGQYVEFKENTDSKKIGETVSAFANTNDGIIIIGVRDRTKEITGIKLEKELSKV